MNTQVETDVVIVGAGLSGLATAYKLKQQNTDFLLLEARNRTGGRILSEVAGRNNSLEKVDLGPSWFWPGQVHMQSMLEELGLSDSVFEQFHQGQTVVEYNNGQIEVGHGHASMAGSFRLEGGMGRLTEKLSSSLDKEDLFTNTAVTDVRKNKNLVNVTAKQHDKEITITSNRVIFTLPPRLLAQTIRFDPCLPEGTLKEMRSKATWMAAQAKFVAVYDSPFWRDQNLSGDSISQLGPLVEIHDASSDKGSPYALFGFVGVPAIHRSGKELLIVEHAVAQINRVFGNGTSHTPIGTHYMDWAAENYTATQADLDSPASHHSVSPVFENAWDNRLIFSGTETASDFGQSNGYLEGALQSAQRTADLLQKQ